MVFCFIGYFFWRLLLFINSAIATLSSLLGDVMKKFYLFLAVVGAIVPYVFFFQFIQVEGLNVPSFVASLFVNGAAAGFSADLLISSFIFWLFMFQQLRKRNSPQPYLFIVLNLTIGLSCALPAYLYSRERNEQYW